MGKLGPEQELIFVQSDTASHSQVTGRARFWPSTPQPHCACITPACMESHLSSAEGGAAHPQGRGWGTRREAGFPWQLHPFTKHHGGLRGLMETLRGAENLRAQ